MSILIFFSKLVGLILSCLSASLLRSRLTWSRFDRQATKKSRSYSCSRAGPVFDVTVPSAVGVRGCCIFSIW